jgi:hypothetical protein
MYIIITVTRSIMFSLFSKITYFHTEDKLPSSGSDRSFFIISDRNTATDLYGLTSLKAQFSF